MIEYRIIIWKKFLYLDGMVVLFEQLRTWEISQKNTFNLYLIGGKKKYSKKKFIIILVKRKDICYRID